MFEAGALLLLPFPFSDTATVKRRPVLASWVRVDRLVTLNAGLVIKVVAKTKAEIHRQAVGGLCEMLQKQITNP